MPETRCRPSAAPPASLSFRSFLDRAVCLFVVAVNFAALVQWRLQLHTLIGAVNFSLAASLLVVSIVNPALYAHGRWAAAANLGLSAWRGQR